MYELLLKQKEIEIGSEIWTVTNALKEKRNGQLVKQKDHVAVLGEITSINISKDLLGTIIWEAGGIFNIPYITKNNRICFLQKELTVDPYFAAWDISEEWRLKFNLKNESYYPVFCFCEELLLDEDNPDNLSGYLMATDSLVRRLIEQEKHMCSPDELATIDNINFYPSYNPTNRTIILEGTYYVNRSQKQNLFKLGLSSAEERILIHEMEGFCEKQTGSSCYELLKELKSIY